MTIRFTQVRELALKPFSLVCRVVPVVAVLCASALLAPWSRYARQSAASTGAAAQTEPQTRAAVIQQERQEKEAVLWPERESPLYQEVLVTFRREDSGPLGLLWRREGERWRLVSYRLVAQ